MKSKIKIVSLSFILFTIFIIFIQLYHQHDFYNKAVNLEKEGKTIFAIDYYGYTITCYTPFSSYINKAKDRLLIIGEKFYKDGKLYKALFAYEILRSSWFQTRSFYQPGEKIIEQLNPTIAKIKVEILQKEGRLNSPAEAEYQRQLYMLNKTSFPSTVGSFILTFSFLSWIVSTILLIVKGFNEQLPNKKLILKFGISATIFFTVWVISLFYV